MLTNLAMDPQPIQPSTASGKPKPLIVSFSGIDGAGKTTQIEMLIDWLSNAGLRVRLVAFWDDVASFRRSRETIGHAFFKGEKGIGSPDKPVNRRDKNVQSWYMLPVRMILCFLDALGLALVVAKIRQRTDADVVIFDRYLYDQLANLNIDNRAACIYIRCLLRLVPHPNIAYLLDTDPGLARARKPEYPLEFLCDNRAAYLAVSKIAGMKLIHAGTPREVGNKVRDELATKLAPTPHWHASEFLTSSQS